MSDICRVALDAMGGDNAPGEVVKGAVEATKKENDIHVVLVGKEAAIQAELDKYDYGKNVKFETYASLRIRGAILDQIRKMDWIPRSLRQKQKKINAAMAAIEAKTGRTSTDEELAAELGISIEELNNWQGQTKMSNLISLDEYTEEGSESGIQAVNNTRFETPEDVVEKEELKKMLVEALDLLTEKEKNVVTLYYYEDLTLKEISLVLNVSESRVSQLHTKALNKMRKKLGDYMEILA